MTPPPQEGQSAKAEPTLKEAIEAEIKDYEEAKGDTWKDEGWRKSNLKLFKSWLKLLKASPPAAERTALAKDIRTYMALQGWASTKKALTELREAKERLEAFAYENDPDGRVIIYTGTDSPKLKKLVKNAVEIDASEGTKSE